MRLRVEVRNPGPSRGHVRNGPSLHAPVAQILGELHRDCGSQADLEPSHPRQAASFARSVETPISPARPTPGYGPQRRALRLRRLAAVRPGTLRVPGCLLPFPKPGWHSSLQNGPSPVNSLLQVLHNAIVGSSTTVFATTIIPRVSSEELPARHGTRLHFLWLRSSATPHRCQKPRPSRSAPARPRPRPS
jgi:hypothetical protein